jgi:hypothetical protein
MFPNGRADWLIKLAEQDLEAQLKKLESFWK